MAKTTRIRRTPEQMAAYYSEKAAKAADRLATEKVASNPILAPLSNAIAKDTARVVALKRSLADSNPNSFEHRRKAFELRIIEIVAGERRAKAELALVESNLAALTNSLTALTKRGDDVSADEVNNLLVMPTITPEITELCAAEDAAHAARVAYKAGIGPDRSELAAD